MKKPGKSRALTTATGVATLQNIYYDRAMLANLKANTSFTSVRWVCACGQTATHEEAIITKISRAYKRRKHSRTFSLCDACFFRYQVMKAAGRLKEFIAAYDEQRKKTAEADRSDGGIIDILKYNKPLPVSSGKTIQMFQYNTATGVTKPKP